MVDFDAVPAIHIPFGPSLCTPAFEEPFWGKLECALRRRLDQNANDSIKCLPDDAKAEIVKEMVEECVKQLIMSNYSPNETPRIPAPSEHHQVDSHTLPMTGQIIGLPVANRDSSGGEWNWDSSGGERNWDSSGGESSNPGLGLTLPLSDFLPGPPRGRSSTCPNPPRCVYSDECECLQCQSSHFNEQIVDSGAYVDDLDDDGQSKMNTL